MTCLQDASGTPAAASFGSGAYADGDAIGIPFEMGPIVPGSGGFGTLVSLVLTDLDKQSATLELLFFKSQPATVPTDNAALDLADADMALLVGTVLVPSSLYGEFADNGAATVRDIQLPFRCVNRSLWCQVVCRDTPTYTVANPLGLAVYARS